MQGRGILDNLKTKDKTMGFLSGKKILITGLASNLSIAYGIAQAMHREGAELAFTYQNDKLKPRVEKMGAEFGSQIFLPCDVASDAEIDAVFASLQEAWGGLDGLIHAIAFAPREAIEGRFLEGCTRENFALAHDISAYSFAALMRGAAPLMKGRNAAALALTYLGAVKAIPNYNTMGLAKASLEAAIRYLAADLGQDGIRVNGISAGPIRTLAASGIKDFRKMLKGFEKTAPLKRCVTIEEVGNTAAFLCSDLASGITGEITYVDGGYNIFSSVQMSGDD